MELYRPSTRSDDECERKLIIALFFYEICHDIYTGAVHELACREEALDEETHEPTKLM